MAKLTGPLFSKSAHGKLAQSLIYSKRKEGNITRKFHMPNKDVALKQWTQRHILGLLTAHWQVKNAAEKLVYEDLAKTSGLNISGFNYFIKVAQADLYTHHGLCGYWSMNESTGAQVTDYSGRGNHGTLKPSYPTNCPARINAMIKQYGKALSFDGVDDYANRSNNFIRTQPELSISVWFKTRQLKGGIVDNMQSDPWRGFELYLSRWASPLNGKLIWSGEYSKGGGIGTPSAVNDGLWHHAVGIITSTYVSLYLDGQLVGSHTGDFTRSLNITQLLTVGWAEDGGYFNGSIDEVRIYNRALSLAEIKKHYELLRLDKKRQPLLIH